MSANASSSTSPTARSSSLQRRVWRIAAVAAGATMVISLTAWAAGNAGAPDRPASGPGMDMPCPHGNEAGGPGHHGPHGDMAGMPGGAGMMPFDGRHLQHLLDEVKATDPQRQQIKAIADKAQTDLRALHEQGRKLHEDGLALWAAPKLDDKAIEAQRFQMQQLHERISLRMTQAMLDAAKVLTPEQRASLVQHMRDRMSMFERMKDHIKDGMGWGHRDGHGGQGDAPPADGRPPMPAAAASH